MANLKGRGNGFIITTDVAGAMGTIPTVANHTLPAWLDTDLYPGEKLYNTTDLKIYIRLGNVMYEENGFWLAPTFSINSFNPQEFREQGLGLYTINITGDRLTGLSVSWKFNEWQDENGVITIENVNLNIIDDNNAELTFANNDVDANGFAAALIFTLEKEGYSVEKQVNVSVPQPLSIEWIETDAIINAVEQQVILRLNKSISNLTNVEVQNDGENVVIESYAPYDSIGDNYVEVMIDASSVIAEDSCNFRVTADGETTEWSGNIYIAAPPLTIEITDIIPAEGNIFIEGEQDIIIQGTNLDRSPNSVAGISVSYGSLNVSSVSYTAGNIVATININSEMLDVGLNFTVQYSDEFTTNWFEKVLNSAPPAP